MEIRYAREHDFTAVRSLWAEAFGKEEPYLSWYFKNVYRPERTLLALKEKETVASLQIAPYMMSLRNELIPIVYLVGVTTAEAYRHQGIGHTLLRRCLNDLAATTYQLALLHTDIPAYYEPVGFSNCYTLRRLRFSALPHAPQGSWQRWSASDGDLALCQSIYRQMCQNYTGYIQRTPQNWRQFCDDHLCDPDSRLYGSKDAYALVWTGDGKFIVREFGYRDAKACGDGLLFLRDLASRKGKAEIVWDAPQSAPLPRQVQETPVPYIMARRLGGHLPQATAQIVEATQAFLNVGDPQLWISEIT